MRRGAEWAVLLATVCLVLAAWVTTSTETPVLHGAVDSPTSTQPGSASSASSEATRRPPAQQPDDGKIKMTFPWLFAIYVLLSLFALALALVVVHAVRPRRPDLPELAPDLETEPHDIGSAGRLNRSLSQVAALGVLTLAEGSPRNSIVRCWLAFEESVEQAGLTRDPTTTAAEFTAAVLARYAVRTDAITVLAALYREARFSEHELTEGHRERAIAELVQLQLDLRDLTEHDDVGVGR